MEMKCKKCKTNMFTINYKQICNNCKHNGWYSIDGYKYNDPPTDIKRDQVACEGECFYGVTYGCGCWLIKCTGCGHIEHILGIKR